MTPRPLVEVWRELGLDDQEVLLYGRDKAKLIAEALRRRQSVPEGALVLVTGINPTAAGEGKTTTAIGVADALRRLGCRAAVALREPSMGPYFGIKGGGTGGGRAQLVPADDINLHFTGDLHAITSAHNLIAAVVDNALYHGTLSGLLPHRVSWRRVLDVNDRALRQVVVGLGGGAHGVARETGFDITAASEIMAIVCLSQDLADLKERLGRVVVGEREDGSLVTVADLGVAGAATVLLKDAIHPNLVQTLEGTPAFVHGGPFGNIAHGSSSLLATKLALKCAEVVLTEAGFGTELGAEKFVHIKCRTGGLRPVVALVVASVRALRVQGGAGQRANVPDPQAVERGLANLDKHVENVRHLGMEPVVALNSFPDETKAEVDRVLDHCKALGVAAARFQGWELGSEGAMELAERVLDLVRRRREPSEPRYLYQPQWPFARKLEAVATTLYGASGVNLLPLAKTKLARYEQLGYGDLALCVAKTQYSLSDDPARLGRPQGFAITVRDVCLAAGAGFVVAYTGDVTTMPGLPKHPAAKRLDLDASGHVVGLT